jgi:3-keto-5-aminohexanoate cleavage enzyme
MELIVNFSPTGMIPTKDMTEHVPVSVNEVVEDVHRAVEIGITMIHLHARDPITGKPTYKASMYGAMIEKIRFFTPDLIIGVSLSGRDYTSFEQRAEPLELDGAVKPDMGSLTLSSLNFNKIASINTPDMIQALAGTMKDRGILPELEAFDAGMINYAKYLEKKELLKPPHYFNLLLGNIACAQADIFHLGVMVNDLPPQSYWSLAGIGKDQFTMNAAAIIFGGGVRLGLEDNIWYDVNRTRLATNADLLKRICLIAETFERPVMKPATLRGLLGMNEGNGKYGSRDDR